MNRTLSNLKISSFYDVNHLQKYEICRKQSACYLLIPPPRPPTIPELFLTTTCKLSLSSSSTFTNFRQRPITDSSYLTIISIILGILIALTSTCLILFLLGVKFRFRYKLGYYHRRHRTTPDINSVNSSIRETNNSDVTFIKTTNTNSNIGSNSNGGGDGCASFSSVIPTSYECSTPLTTTTTIAHNQYPSLAMTNNSNLSLHLLHSQQYLNSDEISLSHHNSTNIYEEIRPTTFDHHCCCCSCTLAYYQKQQQQQQQQCISNNRQLTPHYYTCEPPSLSTTSTIVCQSCLLETLHRKQQTTSTINCACRNFFIPIK
ncbi:unnamed protein product [Rotaria sp. Silwood1]|nr:unnamed protein product [Rotaria sp. Silwood1]CAF3361149.1 unnamed protein product [Rotaria sp. Silwood1]CAF4558626.1 unnamed protein product [Rotaria sp. Silwood1]